MTTLDGALLFAADDGQDGQELWNTIDQTTNQPKLKISIRIQALYQET